MRVSYTLLKLWADGKTSNAIDYYLKRDFEPTKQMIDGKAWHEKWSAESLKTGRLPEVFGGKFLTPDPKIEVKLVVDLADWLQLVGVIDLLDGNTIYEYKTGVTSSTDYAESLQAEVYSILCVKALKIRPDKAWYLHYNQYTKKIDCSMVWLTDGKITKAAEWVVSVATDMKNEFEKIGIDREIAF
jgi:hypothetical protein